MIGRKPAGLQSEGPAGGFGNALNGRFHLENKQSRFSRCFTRERRLFNTEADFTVCVKSAD